MALVLAIDIRNTRTRIGLAVDGRLVSQWAVPTDSAETADGAVACVLGFFDALARNLAPIEKDAPDAIDPVSYTHLDVYKRQLATFFVHGEPAVHDRPVRRHAVGADGGEQRRCV